MRFIYSKGKLKACGRGLGEIFTGGVINSVPDRIQEYFRRKAEKDALAFDKLQRSLLKKGNPIKYVSTGRFER